MVEKANLTNPDQKTANSPFAIQQIVGGFLLIGTIFLLAGMYVLVNMNKLGDLSSTIHQHPHEVSNASLKASLEIAKMHRSMKDVVLRLANDEQLPLQTAIQRVNEGEKEVFQNLDIIKEKALGSKGQGLEAAARELFIDWQPIRAEVITLVQNGELKKATLITTGKGARHMAEVEKALLTLTSYARKKTDDLVKQALAMEKRVLQTTVILIASGIIVSLLIAFFVIRNLIAAISLHTLAEEAHSLSEKKYRSLVNQSITGIYMVQNDSFIVVNKRFCEIFGYSEEEILTSVVSEDLIVEDDHDLLREKIRQWEQGEVPITGYQIRGRHKDGSTIWLEIHNSKPIIISGNSVRSGTLLDITDRKHAEEELEKHRNYLQELVTEKTTELNGRVDAAEQLNSAMINLLEDLEEAGRVAEKATRAKSDFLANMSHEIRTPMNAIVGLGYLALQTDLTTKQRDYLNKIQFSSNCLLRIIDDILDFSKIEAGKLKIESVNFLLEDVLQNVVDMVSLPAHEKGLELLLSSSADIPTSLVGDPLRLGQVLINLLSNAVKFTEQGETLVSTELDKKNHETVTLRFCILDSGIGMSEEQIAKIFKPFGQADISTTRKYGGSGLGLIICQRLVEMMGGEISVDSTKGEGSVFSFTADFGIQPQEMKKKRLLPGDIDGVHVLVVDDSATAQDILRQILESFKCTVSLADSGEDGLAQLKEASAASHPFDMVLMDWKMPGMDGLEASRRIKADTTLEKTPAIIMVTAYEQEEIRQQVKALGIDGFLLKPVTSSTLLDSITEVFAVEVDESMPQELMASSGREQLQGIQGTKILLVEDNKINQQVAQEILEHAGLVVEIANDGKEAVAMVERNQYDAILMDIQMPVMDGLKATQKIREWEKNSRASEPPILIIAMTAHAMTRDRRKSLDAGMNDHINKPIDPENLYSCLARWIQPKERSQWDKGNPEINRQQEETEQSVYFPKSIPGLELKTGLKRVLGNKRLYVNLLRDFQKENENFFTQTMEALENNDIETAERLTHTLKGVTGNIGAVELQKKALALETSIVEQSENVQKQLADTSQTLQDLFDDIRKVLPEEQEVSVITPLLDDVDMKTLSPKVDALKKLLEISDMEAENSFLEIKEDLFALQPEYVAQLAKAIGSLDFKRAFKALKNIIEAGNIS